MAAQWRQALRARNVTEAYSGARLLKELLTLRNTTEEALRDRIVALDQEIIRLDEIIIDRESALNAITYQLYQLTPDEIAMVEGR